MHTYEKPTSDSEISYRYLRGRHIGREQPHNTHLTEQQEKDVVTFANVMSARGMALTTTDIQNIGAQIVRSRGINNKISIRWAQRLIKKNKMAIRLGNVMNRGRLCSATEENFHNYFDMLQKIITEHQIDSGNIINMDETGWSKAQQFRRRKIHPVGKSHPIERQIMSLDHITTVHSHTSSGLRLPTFVIYKKSIPKDIEIPSNFILRASESGFINRELFEDYVTSVLIPWTSSRGRRGPFLLLIDNASPHISYQAFKLCSENNIQVLSLVPNASAWLQPLDQLFYLLKKNMYDIASSLCLLSFGFIVNKKKFLDLLKLSETSSFTPQNIKTAFRVTGIAPFNPSIAIEKANAMKCTSYEQTQTPEPEPCSTCGRIDPCPDCLIKANPLARNNILNDSICKQILQFPAKSFQTPSARRNTGAATHFTNPDTMTTLNNKQNSSSVATISSSMPLDPPSPSVPSPELPSESSPSKVASPYDDGIPPISTTITRRGRHTRVPQKFLDSPTETGTLPLMKHVHLIKF